MDGSVFAGALSWGGVVLLTGWGGLFVVGLLRRVMR